MPLPAEPSKKIVKSFINADSGAEMARQMSQEALITRAMGGLLPQEVDVAHIQRVLDVYCGPGGWVLDMAFAYPHIDIIGIDSNAHMIDYARAQARVQGLKNAHFLTIDPLIRLDFPDNLFQLINARFIAPFLKREDWPILVSELLRLTQPGGIVRLTEFDDLGISTSAAGEKMRSLYAQAMARNQQSFYPHQPELHCAITPMLRYFLQEAGCQEVREQAHVLNYSTGSLDANTYYDNLQLAYKLGQPFLYSMGVAQQDELDSLYEQMQFDMLSNTFCGLWYFLSAWGQKPIEEFSLTTPFRRRELYALEYRSDGPCDQCHSVNDF